MTGGQWAYLVSTVIGAGIAVFVAADLAEVTWAAMAAPKYVIGSIGAMAIAVANYFKPNPKQ